PVETSHFIRTVVLTITGADTTVISHLIHSFGAMVGSIDGANVLAWSVVAMLTKHRLEYHLDLFRVVEFASRRHRIISVDPDPVHVVETQDLIFADHGHVVLS